MQSKNTTRRASRTRSPSPTGSALARPSFQLFNFRIVSQLDVPRFNRRLRLPVVARSVKIHANEPTSNGMDDALYAGTRGGARFRSWGMKGSWKGCREFGIFLSNLFYSVSLQRGIFCQYWVISSFLCYVWNSFLLDGLWRKQRKAVESSGFLVEIFSTLLLWNFMVVFDVFLPSWYVCNSLLLQEWWRSR